MGQVILCSNRLTTRINKATWYPLGYSTVVDITYIDIGELLSFRDPVAAYTWAEKENSHGN